MNVCFTDGLHSKIKPVLQRSGIMFYSSSPFPSTASSFIHSLRVISVGWMLLLKFLHSGRRDSMQTPSCLPDVASKQRRLEPFFFFFFFLVLFLRLDI